jgi:hypothetical protein
VLLLGLVLRILATGVVDAAGNFIARQPMGPHEIAAVKFDIANIGSGATGSYYFTVSLPMQTAYSYLSPVQMSLAPGAHVESTLRFRPVASGGGSVIVNADTTNSVKELNEGNNASAQWITAGSWSNYQYTAPYVY